MAIKQTLLVFIPGFGEAEINIAIKRIRGVAPAPLPPSNPRAPRWTAEEDAMLLALYVDQRMPRLAIAARMPARTLGGIDQRLHALGASEKRKVALAALNDPDVLPLAA